MHILMITTEWPSPQTPHAVPFVVRQVENLRRTGINVDVFHFRGAKNPFRYLRAWIKVRKRLSKNRYDLVHAQWGQSALLAFPKKLPIVVTYRGSDLEGFLNKKGKQTFAGRILRLVSWWVALQADKVIVVSRHLAKNLPNRSYDVIPSGLDLKLFRPLDKLRHRNLLQIPSEDKIILFAGNPTIIDKRFELANSAVSLVKGSFPNVRLLVANGVAFEKMPLYMNISDALILTSTHEGSPNIVKEALACNLPVVSTNVGDVRERIGDIEGCIVCEDDSLETIAAALIQILSRGGRIDGRQSVIDLDERLLTQKLVRIYADVTAKKNPKKPGLFSHLYK